MQRNPYKSLTDRERVRKDLEKKHLEKKIKDIASLGKKILSTKDYIRYKKMVEDIIFEAIKMMIKNVNPDPIKDGFFLRCTLNKLDAFLMLVDLPEMDAKKEAKK